MALMAMMAIQVFSGINGRSETIIHSLIFTARQQERQVCAKLANKGYEPPWKTLEVETVDDWWGMAKMGARIGFNLQSILLDGNK